MKNFEKINQILKDKGVEHTLLEVNAGSASVDDHVKALGIKYTEGLSTLLYKINGSKYIAILRRDDRNIDTKALKKLLGTGDFVFCNDEDLANLGLEPGLASPFLLPELQREFGVRVFVDSKSLEMNKVICGSGSAKHAIEITKDELIKYIGDYEVVEITIPNPKRQNNALNSKKRILTGDTPSGKLHIGHYVGALENRVKLQSEYDTFVILANVHAYANDYTQSVKINESVYNVFLDNLAVGIDPNISTVFLESAIPELYELYTFFLHMVKHQVAMRNPSVKDEIIYKKLDPSMGFVAYPIMQAADILGFNADLVPVGEDQLPVIEQVREIARDFNRSYGDTFVVPEAKVGRIARLVGTDGKLKMSKSGANSILLSDDEESLKKKVMGIYTDPNRIHATDPGVVEGNPVFIYHDAFNANQEEVKDLKERYKKGSVGDIEVKEKLFKVLNEFLKPIRERRKYFEDRPDEAKQILIDGTNKARKVVQETTELFRERIGINKLVRV